jgi:lipopolysaccharide transport protein LptA
MRAHLIVLCLFAAHSQAADLLEQGGNIGADLVELDLRNDQHQLHGNVRISQGPMSIASEEATASALQTDNSRWTFEHSVHVQTAEADLKSNTATARFANGTLREAVVKGSPATFEQRLAPAEKLARGRAGQIEYDFVKGIVKMTNDVWFTYGGNEFRGNVVVYNVRDERVTVNGEGRNNGRVNIKIRPTNGVKRDPATAPLPDNENGA